MSLLTFVAFGWTITFQHTPDFDLYIPLQAMMGMANVILTLLGKIADGEHDKYHMFDTIPSYILVVFKFIYLFVFVGGCVKTLLENKKKIEIHNFYKSYLILGSLYIFSMPLLMYLITYTSSVNRKQIFFIIFELIKNAINFILVYMVSYTKSAYQQVNMEARSFMDDSFKYM